MINANSICQEVFFPFTFSCNSYSPLQYKHINSLWVYVKKTRHEKGYRYGTYWYSDNFFDLD